MNQKPKFNCLIVSDNRDWLFTDDGGFYLFELLYERFFYEISSFNELFICIF